MADLRTDYTDAIYSGKRKYQMIYNSDGTVSFEDVTQYENQENSFFGAADANAMNTEVNAIRAFHKGDTVTINRQIQGAYLTAGSKVIASTMNLGRPVGADVSGISAAVTFISVRGGANGGYLISETSSLPSGVSMDAIVDGEINRESGCFTYRLRKTTTYTIGSATVSNNSAVTVDISVTITFT